MRKSLLLTTAIAALPLCMSAQVLKTGDVVFPSSSQLPNYVEQWNGGAGTITIDGVAWEDQEFFTSRVKPRTRVTATGTNIYDFGSKSGRRAMWWVPVDDTNVQGIPNGRFNSEAFSMWSYIDIYGVFTAPYGWVTGAFADICHKNGVATGGQASMPWAGFPNSTWETCMTGMANKYSSEAGIEALGKFLYYHGCDGLGYNSESSGWASIIGNIRTMHNGLMKYMQDRNPVFENIWYDGTNDSGSLAFDSFLSGKTQLYVGASIFSNYNWNVPSNMGAAVTRANGVTGVDGNVRGPWWNYAGMNQQGGEPKSGETYPYLKDYDWSMGWWGAHSNNMFWESRGSHGTSDQAILMGYLKTCEQFWGNGARNPAIAQEVKTVRSHRPSDDFFGISQFLNERSVLNQALGTEPFYTFFNLGNGPFFNWKGERVSDNGWCSVAVQDFLPTWRFWTAPTWLQKSVEAGSTNLNVGFTYEDAYFGGSCLKIEGTTDTEYLHLFKTQMTGLGSKQVTVRYKLLEGKGDLRLILTSVNTPDTESSNASLKKLQIFTTDECEELENNSYKEGADGWQEKTFSISAVMGNNTNMPGGLGAIGLEFKNAQGMKLLLGEISIMAKTNTKTPDAPVIRSAKVLRNVSTGVDGKIIWTMDNDVARMAGTPKYNSDVNTSMFKLYSREEGQTEAHFLGVTTSWAAVVFRAPNTDASKKIQFGVSAVAMDTRSESEITWTPLYDKGDYVVSEEIALSKVTIKPNEEFKAYFVDKKHESVHWKITAQDGTVVAETDGIEINMPEGIAEWGGYDLHVGDKLYSFYIQISEEKVGALPEIHSIANEAGSVEGIEEVKISIADNPTLSYTGRKANGSASRGVNLNSTFFGTKVGDTGVQSGHSFSVSVWLRLKSMPTLSYQLLDVSDMTDGWPINKWGWVWCHGLPSGRMYTTFRGNKNGSAAPGELHYTYPKTVLQPGVWTHMCWVQEYDAALGFRHFLYVNGVKQESKVFSYRVGGDASTGCRTLGDGTELNWITDADGNYEGVNDGDIWIDNQTHPISASDWLFFGGATHQGAAPDGVIDDFQLWYEALDAEGVKTAMGGFGGDDTLPEGLLCYWDFENEPVSNYFQSRGSNSGVNSCSHTLEHEGGNPEAPSVPVALEPIFEQGCPFLEGTAYPVITEAVWKDSNDRRTGFAKTAADREDEAGSATVSFRQSGDHNITLTLENTYGSDSRTYPVYIVDNTAIDMVGADEANLNAYTIDRTLFLEFAAAGEYTVQVFNTAGMLVGNQRLNAEAGQAARVDLAAAGMYLVKVVKDGQTLRTLKVLSK